MKIKCVWCPGEFDDIEGTTHEYMESSPGCWTTFNIVVRKELQNYAEYGGINRITTDTYAVQHPGVPSRKSTQSVISHLVSLYHIYEKNVEPIQTINILNKFISKKHKLEWLDPPDFDKTMHIGQILDFSSSNVHKDLVRKWGKTVWDAWKHNHFQIIESWANQVY